MKKIKIIIFLLLFCTFCTEVFAETNQNPAKVVIALKWFHQFQFAGFYAALYKGFYRDEGLDVTLTVPENNVFPIESVLSGRAQYGISDAELLISRVAGKPLVAIAVIFQHSPNILISKKQDHLQYLTDYIGKKVEGNAIEPEVNSMFIIEGVNPHEIKYVPHSFSVESLVKGRVDALSSYITNEPYYLRKQGIEIRIIKPIDYGIDFYSDTIFTTENEIRNNPERVAAVRRASIRGWEYAFDHRDEIISLILSLSGVRERGITKEKLQYEAEQMELLIQPKLVEIGHINPDRWGKMASIYAKFGIINTSYSLDGFIYRPEDRSFWYIRVIRIILFSLIFLIVVAGIIGSWNYQLQKLVSKQIKNLNENQELIRLKNDIFDTSISGNCIFNTNGVISEVNDTFLKLWKYTSKSLIIGRNIADFITADQLANTIIANLSRIGMWEGEFAARCSDDTEFIAYGHSMALRNNDNKVIGYHSSVYDITDRRRAEKEKEELQRQLIHSQKMESIGNLAGGVAHDFNNILAGITGGIQLIQQDPKLSLRSKEYASMILKTTERAASLTTRLLAFSRKINKTNETVDFHEVLDDAAFILNTTVDKKIKIVISKNAEQSYISANYSQMQNAILNLGINAAHAMPNGGRIDFLTKNVYYDDNFCRVSPFNITPGMYLNIEVSDTGVGIPEEVITKIFDPFFTTKAQGEGTGLGLWVVYGLVIEAKGTIDVTSLANHGTTFTISLPIVEKTIPVKNVLDTQLQRNDATILFADDEESIRVFCHDLLASFGFSVILAKNGAEAISIFQNQCDKINVVVLDMIMPDLSGKDVFYKIKQIKNDVKVVISSGYFKDIDLTAMYNDGLAGIIKKPYKIEELSAVLNKILNV